MNEKQKIFMPILIVEDEEDHYRLIKKSLNEAGLMMNELYRVENGQYAIDFLKKEGKFADSTHALPTLILLDIKLPMKNGFEVLEEVKADENLKNIPVIMLTTTSNSEDIERAMSLGANDYIVKPVKFKDFISKISRLGYYWGLVSDIKKVFN